jgi:NADH:ubiquinone oxidoreductase subunit 4 (subunit M)
VCQTDLRSLIGYSAAHIGIVIGCIMTSYWGFCGSFTLMVAHGCFFLGGGVVSLITIVSVLVVTV